MLFRSMIITSLKDKISLCYATVFPLLLLFGIDAFISKPDYEPLLLTGVITLSVVFWSVQGIAFQVFSQRNKGLYKQLKITPYQTGKFVLIMVVARTLIGVIINSFILLLGIVMYDIDASLLGVLLSILTITLSTFCFTFLGFFIANFAKNEGQINMYSNLIYLPMIFGSEAFYSLENAPSWLSFIGKILPFHHTINMLRCSLDISDAGMFLNLVVIISFMFGFLLLAIFTFSIDNGLKQSSFYRGKKKQQLTS
ncbi:ABC transporter permease [Metabacillus litoralis]|uniref:Transport permease protein n=1 Tax=Metabacillus litoralis TaxID=152268 RepID=A0A5C6W4E1_9BACI|nr:ABC transporter permease [Metabacillus litoralis]TXC92651.1 ABC transporter permease [Metabacillus litoralis]